MITAPALAWATLMLYAVAIKIPRMPVSMLRTMRDIGVPPRFMGHGEAWAHLIVQFILSIGLFIPATYLPASVGACVLSALYLALIIRARGAGCRCLGNDLVAYGPWLIARNSAVLVLAGASVFARYLALPSELILSAGSLLVIGWSEYQARRA